MVLHEIGSEKLFDQELLAFIREMKNNDVRRILEAYQPTEASLTIPRLSDTFQATLLHIAAKSGNKVISKYLIDLGSEVDARDRLNRTPLTLALSEKNVKVILVLLEANANLQLTNSYAKFVLDNLLMTEPMDSSIKKYFKEMSLQKLVKIGFANHVRDAHWWFCQIAVIENIELLKLVLDEGRYSVDSDNGTTALHIAVQRKNVDMVKTLLEYGADVNALDSRLTTPIRYLYYDDSYRKYKYDGAGEHLEILEILLSHEIVLTSCCSAGYMQVHNVLVYGCKEAVKLVLQRVDDLSVADEQNGGSMVHYLVNNRTLRKKIS